MNQLLTEGDRVYIEFCILCEQHQWCTKHSSSKYLSYFNLCKTELLRFRPDLKVYSNEIPPKLSAKFHLVDNEKRVVPGKLTFPRIGAFEVYYRGILVFSKLKSGLWPRPEIICENVRKIEEEEVRKEQERERRRGKRGKSRKKKRRKKSTTMGSARTSPSRTMKSSQEPFTYSPSKRPTTSKPRTASAKRSRSPKSVKGYTNFSNEHSSQPYRHSLSSEESVKQYHDEGIQADRFASGEVAAFADRAESSQKSFEDNWSRDMHKSPDVFRAEEEQKAPADRPKTAKRPVEAQQPAKKRDPSPPQVLQIATPVASSPAYSPPAEPMKPVIPPPVEPAKPTNPPPVNFPMNPPSQPVKFPTAQTNPPEPTKTSSSPEPVKVPFNPPSFNPPAETRKVESPPRLSGEKVNTSASKPVAEPTSLAAKSSSSEEKPRYSSSESSRKETRKGAEQSEDEDQHYESSEFEEEGEEQSPVHPLRPVTKSYNVEIPMGKYTNKKITYANASDADATFTLISSHPAEMHVKENEVSIAVGDKGALKLQFNPVYEECEKRFYLYLDRDDEPWDCFEFVVKFT